MTQPLPLVCWWRFALFLGVACGWWSVAAPRPVVAEDDVVAAVADAADDETAGADDVGVDAEAARERGGFWGALAKNLGLAPGAKAAKDPLAGYLGVLANEPVVLAWKEGRLIVDVPATQAALYGEDFARTRQAVQQTLDRAAKLLADEGVAQGLARDKAEELFRGARQKLCGAAHDNRLWQGDETSPAEALFRDDEPRPAEVAVTAFTQALEKTAAKGFVAGGGGHSASGGSDGYEATYERGPLTLRLRVKQGGELSASVSDANRSLTFDMAAEPRLTLKLNAAGDPDDEDGDLVLVRQTAKGFRARIVREGEEVLNLEGGSFRDCCRAHSEAVQRELAPLLQRVGVRLPPMPDDAAVQAEVVARLRKAAGTDQPGGAEEVAPGGLEARKHRVAQLSATIDAFGLLDDRRYLEDLKQTAAPDDARAIEERLAALPAGP
jgi:hypothetical protein